MRRHWTSAAASLSSALAVLALAASAAGEPLALHPDNPHCFLFHGRPTVLITSGEHYGAVLNRDFDYAKYLEELATHGLNLTRTFSGAYAEAAASFGIARNTLAPAEGRLICPWARSKEPGYAGGGAKFDLEQWDPEYFTRLKDFLRRAGERGVVVELNLFCPFYQDEMWQICPMNAANNVNGVGNVARESVYDREKNGDLQGVQETLVRKLVSELNEFDNLYFEVCNEPYAGNVTDDWQRRIVDVIVETERPLANKHLVSLNISNGSKKVTDPHPAVGILNFHYASPPEAVAINYDLGRVIGDNETGFKGAGDEHYRMEGWEFVLAGGGLYNNLDYSFAVGYEDGSFDGRGASPGGGGLALRRQLKVLKEFIDQFNFVRMKPDNDVIQSGLPANGRAHVLSEPGQQYAGYVFGGPAAKLSLALPQGHYQIEWIDPSSGKSLKSEAVNAAEAATEVQSPAYDVDVAFRLRRTD